MVNVTEKGIREYIDAFLRTIDETAKQFLPQESLSLLIHTSLLPSRVVAYVSTQYGVAIEYLKSERTQIEVVRGSARVEELLLQAPNWLRFKKELLLVGGNSGWRARHGIRRMELNGAFPFRCTGSDFRFTIEESTFNCGPWSKKIKYAEVYGNRSAEFWSKENAVARAKDEVLAAMVQINNAKTRSLSLGDYIAQRRQKTVLVLGDYNGEGMVRLEAICKALLSQGYDPVLVKDLPDQLAQSLDQKVSTVGHIARFVVVDDSTKSGHLYEIRLCQDNEWVTVLLRKNGRSSSAMTRGVSVRSNVMREQGYEEGAIEEAVASAVEWAEAKFKELSRDGTNDYPWRAQN